MFHVGDKEPSEVRSAKYVCPLATTQGTVTNGSLVKATSKADLELWSSRFKVCPQRSLSPPFSFRGRYAGNGTKGSAVTHTVGTRTCAAHVEGPTQQFTACDADG